MVKARDLACRSVDHSDESAGLFLAARDQADGACFLAHLAFRERPSQHGLRFNGQPGAFVERPAILHEQHRNARVSHERIYGQRERLELAIDAHSRNVLVVVTTAARVTRTSINIARGNVAFDAAVPRSIMSVNLQDDEIVGRIERAAACVEFDVIFQRVESATRGHFVGSERPASRQRDVLLGKLGDGAQRILAEDSCFTKIPNVRIHRDDHGRKREDRAHLRAVQDDMRGRSPLAEARC